MRAAASAEAFDLPEELAASEPPEARGLERDQVRLMVARPDRIEHTSFWAIGAWLEPGDLVVVNTSATLPAAVDGSRAGEPITVHFSTRLDDTTWIIELRAHDRSGPLLDGRVGEVIELEGGGRVEISSAVPGIGGRTRMLTARLHLGDSAERYLARTGRPIAYSYVDGSWPLHMYQTVFARQPGSAEMPSAGRPFTHKLVTDLIGRGIAIAPVMLHAGVSSLEKGETPLPERFGVPAATARLVNATRAAGKRVVAVGTTVTRALESAAHPSGLVSPAEGWADVVLGPERPARVVGGLVTGWHAIDASHRMLLEAVAGAPMVDDAYRAALAERYLWHEFGDTCLLLP